MKRRLAREMAVQCLYQMDMNEVEAHAALSSIIEEATHDNEANIAFDAKDESVQFIRNLVEGTLAHKQQLDDLLQHYLKGWKMDRLSKVDLQILRLAGYEMVYVEDVPPKAVVNEAIELAKHFGTEESGKFVNGVLGKLLKELDEVKQRG